MAAIAADGLPGGPLEGQGFNPALSVGTGNHRDQHKSPLEFSNPKGVLPGLPGRQRKFDSSGSIHSPDFVAPKPCRSTPLTRLARGSSASPLATLSLEGDFRGVRGCISTTSELSGPLALRFHEGGKVPSEFAAQNFSQSRRQALRDKEESTCTSTDNQLQRKAIVTLKSERHFSRSSIS